MNKGFALIGLMIAVMIIAIVAVYFLRGGDNEGEVNVRADGFEAIEQAEDLVNTINIQNQKY